MTYPYRCTSHDCRARRTLAKHKDRYQTEPRCEICGGNLVHDPEVRRRAKRDVCRCDGYHYPHRKGTEPWCEQAKIGPTEEDWKERYESIS